MPKTEINGNQLYYEVHGKGAPLLLIGGLGSDHQSWLTVLGELAKSFQVIVYDNRGAGQSDVRELTYSIADLADDAAALLDYLSIKKAHLAGHSMGGYIAQELAINYPERVNKLVLESTAPVSSERNNVLFKYFLNRRRQNTDLESWFKLWQFWLFTPERFTDKDFMDTFTSECLKNPHIQSPNGFKGQVEAITGFDARGRLGKITAKTLVVEGKEDILILPKEARTLVDNIPESSLLLIENAAHALHLEAPAAFIKAAAEFLR